MADTDGLVLTDGLELRLGCSDGLELGSRLGCSDVGFSDGLVLLIDGLELGSRLGCLGRIGTRVEAWLLRRIDTH